MNVSYMLYSSIEVIIIFDVVFSGVTVQFALPSYTFTENGVVGFVEVMKSGPSSSSFRVQVIGGMCI